MSTRSRLINDLMDDVSRLGAPNTARQPQNGVRIDVNEPERFFVTCSVATYTPVGTGTCSAAFRVTKIPRTR